MHRSASSDPAVHLFHKRFHIEIENRGDVERKELGEEQAANHGHPQRTARLRAGTMAERDGQRPHDSRHRGHHNGAEADKAAIGDRLQRALPFIPLTL